LNDAIRALGLWFESQGITLDDAVLVMAATVVKVIEFANQDNPKQVKKLKAKVARMIKEAE
jgi:hypothetical protein